MVSMVPGLYPPKKGIGALVSGQNALSKIARKQSLGSLMILERGGCRTLYLR